MVYQITEMQDQGGDQYLGVVPGSFAGPTGIDYFIRAVDNWGLSGFYGSAANPVHVDTCPHEPGPLVRVPPDTCVYPGEPNCIPVYLDGLPPWEVTSVQMVLLYDELVIQATQATTANSIAEAWGEPTYSVSPGEILIDMGGTPALDATGVLVWVCFDAVGEVGETSLLEFEDDSVSLGGSNVWAQGGIVRVCPRGIAVDLDIKPQSCPNPLNTSGGAPPVARFGGEDLDGDIIDPPASELGESVLPVAILGANHFEASTIDPNSVRLEGVSPLRWNLEDVAAPVESDDTCECTTAGPDGYDDFALKFSKREVLTALEAQAPFVDREVRVLTITGMTWDGTPIVGHDCVVIIHNNYFETDPLRGYGLRENYPNPFNPQTDISFTLSERARVTLIVYNVAGKKVKTLIAGEMEAGTYTVRWNGTDQVGNRVASGIYLCRMEVGGSSQTMKMVLMK